MANCLWHIGNVSPESHIRSFWSLENTLHHCQSSDEDIEAFQLFSDLARDWRIYTHLQGGKDGECRKPTFVQEGGICIYDCHDTIFPDPELTPRAWAGRKETKTRGVLEVICTSSLAVIMCISAIQYHHDGRSWWEYFLPQKLVNVQICLPCQTPSPRELVKHLPTHLVLQYSGTGWAWEMWLKNVLCILPYVK